MTNVLTFNRALVAVVCKELLTEVTELRNSLSKSAPWEPDVADRFNRLARIAKTAQLRGIFRALSVCAAGAKKLSLEPTEEVLTNTIGLTQSLLVHLQESVNDHRNTPIKLARPIQQLNQALGITSSPMLAAEMYIPFVPEDVSAPRPTENSPSDFIAAVTEHRSAYQTALIKLIKEADMSQLSALRQTLVTLEPKNPHSGYRVFFEASIAVFDILIKTGQLDNATKWVVGKIDPELSLLIQGATQVSDDLLSTILYVVAKASPDTGARVRKLQDQFGLKSYIAELTVVDQTIIDKFLAVLVKARELWSTKQDLQYMLKITGDLLAKAGYLHNSGFTTVITALHEALDTIHNQHLNVSADELSLEGASALLVLEQQLRDGSDQDLANVSAARVLRLIGKNVVNTNAGEKHAGASVVHQIGTEIQDDLTQLEPRLLEMLNDQHDGEADFRAGLVKIAKILRILGKDNPLSLAFITFEKNLKIEHTVDDRAAVAAQYAQLGTLVEHLKTSEKTAMTAAQKWLDALQPANTAQAENHSENTDLPNDKEMLEIFLEEADGIIQDLRKWLKALKADPSEHDTLVNARRGYHTLKGSGRMVGLSRFGDMAYITELLLNNWIAGKKLVSPELHQYLDDATDRVATHIKDFQTVGYSEVFYEDLEARAIALGGTPLADAPQSKKARGASAAPAVAPAPATRPAAIEPPVPVAPAAVIEPPVLDLPAIQDNTEPEEQIEPEPAIPTLEFDAPQLSLADTIPATPEPTLELEPEPAAAAPVPQDIPSIAIEESPLQLPVPPAEPEPEPELSITLPVSEPDATPELSFALEPVVPDAPAQIDSIDLTFEAPESQHPQIDSAPAFEIPSHLNDLVIEVPGEKHAEVSPEPEAPVTLDMPLSSTEATPVAEVPKIAPPAARVPAQHAAPKKKPRETPAAWQKTSDRKQQVATKEAPSAPAKRHVLKTTPVKRNIFTWLRTWISKLFRRTK